MDDTEFWSRLQQLVDDHRTEADFHKLCKLFRESTPAQRQQIRAFRNVSGGRWIVPAVDTLASGEPTAVPPEVRVRDALTWQAIEGGAHDIRDSLMSIVLIYHSAARLGMDVVALFDEVAELAAPDMREAIASFPRRAQEDRSLAAFSYVEIPTAKGVRYEYRAGPFAAGAKRPGGTP